MARKKSGQSLPNSSSPQTGGSGFEKMSAMGDSSAGTKSGGDLDSFGSFLLGYTGLQGLLPMHFDAIRDTVW